MQSESHSRDPEGQVQVPMIQGGEGKKKKHFRSLCGLPYLLLDFIIFHVFVYFFVKQQELLNMATLFKYLRHLG